MISVEYSTRKTNQEHRKHLEQTSSGNSEIIEYVNLIIHISLNFIFFYIIYIYNIT